MSAEDRPNEIKDAVLREIVDRAVDAATKVIADGIASYVVFGKGPAEVDVLQAPSGDVKKDPVMEREVEAARAEVARLKEALEEIRTMAQSMPGTMYPYGKEKFLEKIDDALRGKRGA